MDNNGKPKNEEEEDPSPTPTPEIGIERELFGKWTVFLRNSAGFISVIVVCLMGLFNCYTTYISVSEHKDWPSELSVFIMVVGPVLCSWAFMDTSKTLRTIFNGTDGLTSFRSKVAKAIAPKERTE